MVPPPSLKKIPQTKFTPNIVKKGVNKVSNGVEKVRKERPQPSSSPSSTSSSSSSSSSSKTIVVEKKVVSEEIIQQKKALPVFSARKALVENVNKHSTVIIISETGTGKTTQIPQYLHEEGYTNKGVIAITQPRRVAAVSISKRVSDEMGVELGQQVGYSVRFDDKSSKDTRLKYMTDGMLVREAMLDASLSKYSVIILDEAHERTLNTDILFGLLKKIQKKRNDRIKQLEKEEQEEETKQDPESSNNNETTIQKIKPKISPLKIIIMSATLDAELFSNYFDNAPILYIEGRQFPVQIYYTNELQKDYVDAALVTVLQIHLQYLNNETIKSEEDENGGDILVFLTGREEIENLEKLLIDRIPRLPEGCKELLVRPIFAALPQEQQMKVFEKSPKGSRKVILATNIAETSLTINGIRYVVDTGVVKSKIYNPKIGIDSLNVIPISKASARQRTGRAGREFEGKCYRLYTQSTFENMDDSSIPEIKRSNVANVILQLKTIGVHDILGFDFLERPPLPTIKKSLEQLYCLEALTDQGNLSELGKKMAMFPLDPMYSKTLLKSVEFNCLEEVLIIISMLSVESIFFIPKDKKQEVESIKKIFFSPEGDHITFLNVFREYQRVKGSLEWCFNHFINIKSMTKVINVFEQLVKYCISIKLKIESCENDFEKVRKSFISGFFMNVAALQPDKKYKTMVDSKEIHIHPTSFLFDIKPQYILYNELTITTKAFARNVLPIEPSWLPEICPKYYGSRPIPQDQNSDSSLNTLNQFTSADDN
ncbi:hypothetical protein CYY_003323 [Polysphondylium violaceum]|uniref:RNA helicase n=1 Tax=Polysphondylium violaceum TaxID=133409 RepID=A0A8J4V603_9MYCE|nr:hypothetical protein CYY_003323 [Polysphondylium violaceum]